MNLPAALLSTAALALAPVPGPAQVDGPVRVERVGPPQSAIDAAIERGSRYLLDQQREDGSWLWRGGSRRPGVTALALYALLRSGVEDDHPAVRRALARLGGTSLEQTYDTACLILALIAHDADQHRMWIDELAGRLVSWQNDAGDWGYPRGADLSNTQYAALGLLAAGMHGVDVEAEVWSRLARGVERYQGGSGGFGYEGRSSVTGSMTAAGVGTLAICDAMLTRLGRLEPVQAETLRESRDDGLEWLGRRFDEVLDPQDGHWGYYRAYGIERVGSLTGASEIGGRRWYQRGAALILAGQNADGGWGDRGGWDSPAPEESRSDVVRTCFALLFLRRATAAVFTGGGEPSSTKLFGTAGRGHVHVAASGGDPLAVWINGWSKAVRKRLEWPGEEGRGPHVLEVQYLVGGIVVARVEGDEERPADFERFAARHHFPESGRHEVCARVRVLGPPTRSLAGRTHRGRVEVLESDTFPVDVEGILPPWMQQQVGDRGRNLLTAGRAKAKASSFLGQRDDGPSHPPAFAVDNRLRTAWMARADDEHPTIEIELRKPQKADLVLISNPRSVPWVAGRLGRVLEVDVLLNGHQRHRLRMHPDERRKARLELRKPEVIRSLELTVIWSTPGTNEAAVGLAEVELQLRAD